MKVTAFIRKTSAKNNVTDLAKIYFRVRDVGGVDIKAVSELTINPNHWSAERQGYKPRVALVSDDKKIELEKSIKEIAQIISEKYFRGADGTWLKNLIDEYHHPNINSSFGSPLEEYRLVNQIRRYIEERPLTENGKLIHQVNINRLERFERFQREVLHRRGYRITIDAISADDLREFREFLLNEPWYYELYPKFYEGIPQQHVCRPLSENSVSGALYRIHTVIRDCVRSGLTRNNPFDRYAIPQPIYGDPFYLTIEERDKVYALDLSGYHPSLAVYRDLFVFQCMIGCRAADLNRLTKGNVVNGAVEYIAQKTKKHTPRTIRVPLSEKAIEIIDRYKDLEDALLPRFKQLQYNNSIKRLLKIAGVDRKVMWLNPVTRQEELRPLHEVATSHTARKTFIGNLYKQVQDPNLIASLSGHTDGSRAFARYRQIDDEMKRKLVDMLD